MNSRLLAIDLSTHRQTGADVELHCRAYAEGLTPNLQLRGRLHGPQCHFASTIELAYPFRSLPSQHELTARIVIPEASFWEPECPFLYSVVVEIYDGERVVDTISCRHGIRRVQMTANGLFVNGRRCPLHGKKIDALPDTSEAITWRKEGINLWIAAPNLALADLADRLGFFVVARVSDADPEHLLAFSRHPSWLGWLIDDIDMLPVLPKGPLGWLAAEPGPTAPAGIDFLITPTAMIAAGSASVLGRIR